MAYVEFDTNGGCWLWTSTCLPKGYGRFRPKPSDKLLKAAHRVAYELWRGPIPTGLQIDHLCRVRCCVNPAHLEAVTLAENVARSNAPNAVNARRTHCVRGHEFSAENTRIRAGRRLCRICYRATQARMTEVKRARRARSKMTDAGASKQRSK